MIETQGEPVRLDLVGGEAAHSGSALIFELPDDHHFDLRVAAIRMLLPVVQHARSHHQLACRLLALQAHDLRASGSSLRSIADVLFGAGEWPGDGDHRKSSTRRLITIGERMMHAGYRAVLTNPDRRVKARQSVR